MQASSEREEQRGLDRIVFFSDAVMAIAMTLLVLPLVELESELDGSVSDLLSSNRDKLLTFALSFVVIARYWSSHHQLFRGIAGFDTRLIWANFAFLFSIVLLPFPTELIGATSRDQTAIGLYIGTLTVTTGSLIAIRLIVSRTPKLQHSDSLPNDFVGLAATLAALVVSLVVALSVPSIGLLALLLLVPAGYVHGPRATAAPSR